MSQSPSSAGAMGIGNVLNIKAEPGAPQDAQQQQGVTPEQQLQQQLQQQQLQQQQLQQHHLQQQLQQQQEQQDLQQQRSLPLLQLQTDRQGSPHGSEHSRYSATMNASYPSPSAMAASPLPPMPNAGMAPAPMVPQEMQQNLIPGVYQPAPEKAAGSPAAKPYPCATCGKPFARRSDLARHERIHSGVRPHRCDFPGCGKQFIQRSALTVHSRVHTGEKPHRCEQCRQPFSDSSSLARHRRIHLGTRPYKCPYVNCQKTFTRRTTLTRHQNHHTGTVEDAARARAEALAQGASAVATATAQNAQKSRSASEQAAVRDSPINTPSPGHRPMSISPPIDLSGMGNMQYMGNSIPVHLRGDVHVASPSPTASSGYNNGMRPTSHPAGYAPPQTLEPSIEPAQGPGSSIGSPHIGSVGWASPGPVGSPAQSPSGNGYVYPDPEGYPSGTPIAQMFYNSAAASLRRGSPDQVHPAFEPKGRQGEIWADAQ